MSSNFYLENHHLWLVMNYPIIADSHPADDLTSDVVIYCPESRNLLPLTKPADGLKITDLMCQKGRFDERQ